MLCAVRSPPRTQFAAEGLNGIPAAAQYEKKQTDFANHALHLGGVLIADAPDSPLGKEGKKRVAELEPIAKKK